MDREFAVEDHVTLAELVHEIEQGESVVLKKDGKAIATVIPRERHDPAEAMAAMERIIERSKGMTLDGLSIRELIDEGRKY